MDAHEGFTMMGGGLFGRSKHRHLSVEKVENGFKVKATFSVGEADVEQMLHSPQERQYVFYTVEEVLDFTKQYLSAPSEKLRT